MAIRDGWTETTLGEIALLINGDRSKKNYPSANRRTLVGIPFINAGHLVNGRIDFGSMDYISEVTFAALSGGKIQEGDILYCLRGTVGKFGLVEDISHGAIASSLVIIRIRRDSTPSYIYLFLDSNSAKNQLEGLQNGAVQPNLSAFNLASFRVFLPTLSEQKRIVDVVSSVDAYIDALQRQIDAARTARNAVLNELLSAGGDDWTETTLGEVAKCAGGTAFPHEFQGGLTGTPFVKVSDMNENGNERYLETANNYVSDEAIKGLRARVWPEGTIVFAKVGAALLTEKRRVLVQRTIFDNNIMGLVPTSKIESLFLYLFMETIRLGDYVQPGAVPSVNNSIVSEIKICLPPVAEQKRIVGIVSSMDDVIQAAERAVVEAKNLRSGLLSDLLSGEHEIPVSYDELLGAA